MWRYLPSRGREAAPFPVPRRFSTDSRSTTLYMRKTWLGRKKTLGGLQWAVQSINLETSNHTRPHGTGWGPVDNNEMTNY